MAPELTVGLIVRNDPEGLLRSAASVFGQTWQGTLVLKVLDDGSTDETPEVLERLEERFYAIERVEHAQRLGSAEPATRSRDRMARARNQILQVTRSRYLAWIDAGDVWHPRKLERQWLAIQAAPGEAIVATCAAYPAAYGDASNLGRTSDSLCPGRGGDTPSFVCGADAWTLCRDVALAQSADGLGPGTRLDRPNLSEGISSWAAATHPPRSSPPASPVTGVPPPFSTLLGTTAAFRAAGDFDETLALFADQEFWLRMDLAGVASVVADPGTRLCAQAARALCDPARAAAEMEAVLARHRRALVQRFGRRGARRYQRRFMNACTRGSEAYNRTGRGAGTSATAPFALRQRYAPYLRKLAAALLAAKPVDPHHPAVAAFICWMTGRAQGSLASFAPGLAALTASDDPRSCAADKAEPELSRVDRAVLTVAHACCAADKLERARALLEAHVQQHGDQVHPRVLERLAAVHLAAERTENAEDLLIAALRRHPENVSLNLVLADTYVREGRWVKAIDQWERISGSVDLGAQAGLLLRIVHAYREIGKPREALACAARAAPPGAPSIELQGELDACARLAAAWPHCLVSVDTCTKAPQGQVEAWGFLAGHDSPLEGRARLETAAQTQIRLRVNGFPVASTWTAPAADPRTLSHERGEHAFAINCADLLYYLGDGDLLEVVSAEGRLELPGGAASVMVHNGFPSRFSLLKRLLEEGFVFTKAGRLKAGHTDESKRAVLDFYEEVADYLEARTGLAVYPFYGNLLGAIRENDFIEHDVDGFDMIVLCRGREPAEIKRELGDICTALRSRGYRLDARPWCIFIRPPSDDAPLLDLSYGWFNEADELCASFGWRHAPVQGKDTVTAPRQARLADRLVKVPGNAEAVLEQLYGPGWRVPNQGYSPLAALTRDRRYLLTELEMATLIGKATKSAA